MKVHTADGRWFALQAETEVDHALLDAIDTAAHRVHVVRLLRKAGQNDAVVLSADHTDPRALKAEADRKTARAIGQLLRLGLRQSAFDGHSSADATNPQSQEELTARLEQLQLMLDSRPFSVGEQKPVLKEVKCAHRCTVPSCGGSGSAK
ncbi:hypothetical protein ABIC63_005628 [Pseudacidovorax sp. 1753]|uniref:hypothetical protein n=1 Tax=Pseudacidovorax sp. 1753 TaxID=3156419 RepID=UPI00339078A6